MESERTPNEMWQSILDLRSRLREGHTVTWTAVKEHPNGSLSFPYPNYEEWLWNGLVDGLHIAERCGGKGGPSYETLFSYGGDPTGIPMAGLDELTGWFLFYVRGERFCDGLIAEGVKDGTILAMADRLVKIVAALVQQSQRAT